MTAAEKMARQCSLIAAVGSLYGDDAAARMARIADPAPASVDALARLFLRRELGDCVQRLDQAAALLGIAGAHREAAAFAAVVRVLTPSADELLAVEHSPHRPRRRT